MSQIFIEVFDVKKARLADQVHCFPQEPLFERLRWIHLRFVGVCVCLLMFSYVCMGGCVFVHECVCVSERCGLSYALLIIACWLHSALIAV